MSKFELSFPRLLSACALACAAFYPHMASAQGEPAAAQSSVAGGVTVKATASNISAEAQVWSFAIVFDTHSQELNDDPAASAVLIADDGRTSKPLAWKGAPAGGHHREGVLEFEPQKPPPKALELRIRRQGEAEARSFRWTL
jgi:hypothetical protein